MPVINCLSERHIDDVLQGNDAAAPLIDICATGDSATLKKMLSEGKWIRIAKSSPPRIYNVIGGSGGTRNVHALPNLNFKFLLCVTARNRHIESTITLLDFARKCVECRSNYINRDTIIAAIDGGCGEVFAALADVHPKVINYYLAPSGLTPLGEAIAHSRTEIVEYLVTHGADLVVEQNGKGPGGFGSSVLSASSSNGNPQITKLLLENGAVLAKSGALHMAAWRGRVDVMEVLVRYGADLDERLPKDKISWLDEDLMATWTPMHFAASKCQEQAFTWLEERGANANVRDKDGNIPGQLFYDKES